MKFVEKFKLLVVEKCQCNVNLYVRKYMYNCTSLGPDGKWTEKKIGNISQFQKDEYKLLFLFVYLIFS